jgi:alpha-glucosidase
VIISLAGTDAGPGEGAPERHRARAAAWLAHDVDGVDLGVTTSTEGHEHHGVDLGALHALAAEADAVLTGGISARTPDALAEHLHEDWLHVTRDDRLALTRWDGPRLRAAVSDSYLQRDAVGAPAGWTLTDLSDGSAPSWGLEGEAARRRRRAATLLMNALPGTVYVSQGEPVGMAPAQATPTATIAEVARLASEQRGTPGSPFERYRHALRLRRELSLGTGNVAWVDDPPYAGTLAFINGDVLVLTNLSDRDVRVPAEREILHTSDDLPMPFDGLVSLPPDTTVWIALA